jgi:hypothetical protein
MAVYVDDARIPARVGRISARWSHLTADTQDELHAFALSIGLRRSWFQPGKSYGARPSRHWHYDVTESKRQAAIRAGARPISGSAEYMAIVTRREAVTAGVTAPATAAVTLGCHGPDMAADRGTNPAISPGPHAGVTTRPSN